MIAAYRRYALVFLVAASFGPVLGGGLRLEHLLAFGLALLGIALGGRRMPSFLAWTGLAWFAMLAVAASDTLRSAASGLLPMQNSLGLPKEVDPIGFKTLLSGAAQLLLPASAAFVAFRADDLAGRVLALRTLVVLTALNTGVAAAQLALPDLVLPLLKWFWPGEEGTAVLAMGQGRFGGVFNHPAEAAMATTLAMFVLPVAWREARARALAVGILLPLLLLGGLLSFSKTVLFLGFPLAFLHLVVEHRRLPVFTRRSGLLLGAWGVFGAIGIVLLAGRLGLSPDTFGNLVALTTVGDGGVVGTATGGRFSAEGGTVAWAFGQVVRLSPVVGLGFGTFLAYDSMYLVAFAYAGAFGLLAYLGVLVAFALRVRTAPHRATLGLTLLFVLLAGLGIPTFTAMRVGVLLTVFVLALAIPTRDERAEITPLEC